MQNVRSPGIEIFSNSVAESATEVLRSSEI